MIRVPLAGQPYVCPVSPEATIWVCTLADTIGNLLRLAQVDGASIGPQRATTTPSLAVSIADIVAAIARADAQAARRISFAPQPAIEAQFGRWPLDCAFDKAPRARPGPRRVDRRRDPHPSGDAMSKPARPLRSTIITEGLDRAPHRAFLRATGLDDEDIGKPFVGIVSQHGENTPCSMSLGPQADAARLGVAAARRHRRCRSRRSRSPTACR